MSNSIVKYDTEIIPGKCELNFLCYNYYNTFLWLDYYSLITRIAIEGNTRIEAIASL